MKYFPTQHVGNYSFFLERRKESRQGESLSQVNDALEGIIKAEGVVHLRTLVMKARVTVMDLAMEVVMMAMQDVRENLCVEVIIVSSLENIIMKKMIAVKNLLQLQLCRNLHQVNDAVDVTTKAEGVVHLRILVMKERVTVMDQVMEVVMMAMQGAGENLCVGVIIVRSLVLTTMTRMIVVRNQNQRNHHHHLYHGESGRLGASAQDPVGEGHGQGHGTALVQGAGTPLSLRKDPATFTLASWNVVNYILTMSDSER